MLILTAETPVIIRRFTYHYSIAVIFFDVSAPDFGFRLWSRHRQRGSMTAFIIYYGIKYNILYSIDY